MYSRQGLVCLVSWGNDFDINKTCDKKNKYCTCLPSFIPYIPKKSYLQERYTTWLNPSDKYANITILEYSNSQTKADINGVSLVTSSYL